MSENLIYFYAFLATFCFGTASVVYTYYSRLFSPLWINCFKVLVAVTCSALVISFGEGFHNIGFSSWSALFFSGMLGLGIGDIFLLSSFKTIRPARTLILFGFQPIVLGILSFFMFQQEMSAEKLWAIVFFILCLLAFSLEGQKNKGSWEIRGLLLALIGMLFDAFGIISSRLGFELNNSISPMEGFFHRALGALFIFILFSFFKPYQFTKNLLTLKHKQKILLFLTCFYGTFLALFFHMKALKFGHLATLGGIAISTPVFAATIECLYYKKLPSKYLVIAFFFFCCGSLIIFF